MATGREIDSVRLAHERFSSRDIDGVIELLDPEVEFTTFLGQFEGRSYRGHDGVREWFASIFDAFPDFRSSVVEIEDLAGDGYLAELRLSGSGAASGAEIERTAFQLVTFRNGRAARWSWYPTRGEALAASGGAG